MASVQGERRRGSVKDPTISANWKAARRLPKRAVVELTADEWETLEQFCGRNRTSAQLIRLVALRLARAVEELASANGHARQ